MSDAGSPAPTIGFPQAVQRGFERYAMFSGRANRPEFWWWTLFVLLVNIAVVFIDAAVTDGILGLVVLLLLLVPNISVTVRRLHDQDKSGWWFLLGFIPFIGWILVLIICVQPGTEGVNKYGPPSGSSGPTLGYGYGPPSA
jgi:uncharacterized membrane protein YhaH (DUF805 family)